MTAPAMVLEVLRTTGRDADADRSLAALARRSGWSASHLHRAFTQVTRETPKQYALRVRLTQAAARLAAGAESVLEVALASGFASHEVFARAFRRTFGCTPSAYRAQALPGASAGERTRHRAVVNATAPCLHLFRMSLIPRRPAMPMLSLEPRTLTEQPVLLVREQISRQDLARAIGEGLGKAFGHAHVSGAAIAGRPFTRYVEMGHGLITIEAGVPVAQTAEGKGDVQAGVLPGGAALVALHAGPYDQLVATYAEMERWMAANNRRPAGAPWELYLNDPADHAPDEWRTEVYWPITDQA